MILNKLIFYILFFISMIFSNIRTASATNEVKMDFIIKTTWDGDEIPKTSQTKLTFNETKTEREEGLSISIEAPFYNDPEVPPSIPPGSVDKLWDFEVVEVFFLAEDGTYLEIELAPRGHYLLLLLKNKEVLKYEIPLEKYTTMIDGDKWKGVAFIPKSYFPSNVTRFNAYAIRGSGDERVYMSLFPVPKGEFKHPDFHRLQPFQPIKIFS